MASPSSAVRSPVSVNSGDGSLSSAATLPPVSEATINAVINQIYQQIMATSVADGYATVKEMIQNGVTAENVVKLVAEVVKIALTAPKIFNNTSAAEKVAAKVAVLVVVDIFKKADPNNYQQNQTFQTIMVAIGVAEDVAEAVESGRCKCVLL